MALAMSELLRVETPYEQFSKNFKQVVNSNNFTKNTVKIFTLQTGGGKSHFQDTEMPLILKDAFPNLKYIFRLSPTVEVARDGTFDNISQLNPNCDYVLKSSTDPSPDFLDLASLVDNVILCVSITHNYFIHNIERLIQYASQSVLCIEEAHQFIGCADRGRDPYMTVSGYGAEYTAETWQRIERWKNINPRVIGFTATPTVHHTQKDKSLTNQFDTVNDLVPLDSILPFQSWLDKTTEYPLERYQGARDIKNHVQNSIDTLFNKEEKLEDLRVKDSNINPKLTGYYICGDTRGVWGCPIDEVRNTIADYLLSIGINANSKMIATMREGNNNSDGGCIIWDLEGNKEKVDNSKILFSRLEDPNDPVRFLLVVSRGRSGINVHNLAVNVVCRIRDPKEIRTHIPIQIFGRMVRTNTGTGNIIRTKYSNNLDVYLKKYSEDYNVDISTVIETIKIANTFDIWYPENPKAKRTWNTALKEFKKYYVNSSLLGYEYLYNFTGVENPYGHIHNGKLADCPWCNKMVEVFEDNGVVTLERFFVD